MAVPTTANALLSQLREAAAAGAETRAVAGLTLYGARGSDGGPGLMAAVRRFVAADSTWSVVNYGDDTLTVSRRPEDKPQLPPVVAQAWNYTKSLWSRLWRGKRLADAETVGRRLSYCWVCPSRVDKRCAVCGCHLDRVPDDAPVGAGGPGKAVLANEECPVGKWPKAP